MITFKSCSFLSQNKRRQALFEISWTLSTSAQQVSQPSFQNQCPFILLSPVSIDPFRLSSIAQQVPQTTFQNGCPFILLSPISIDPFRLSSLHKFYYCSKAKLSPRSLSSLLRQRQITNSSQLKGSTMKT